MSGRCGKMYRSLEQRLLLLSILLNDEGFSTDATYSRLLFCHCQQNFFAVEQRRARATDRHTDEIRPASRGAVWLPHKPLRRRTGKVHTSRLLTWLYSGLSGHLSYAPVFSLFSFMRLACTVANFWLRY